MVCHTLPSGAAAVDSNVLFYVHPLRRIWPGALVFNTTLELDLYFSLSAKETVTTSENNQGKTPQRLVSDGSAQLLKLVFVVHLCSPGGLPRHNFLIFKSALKAKSSLLFPVQLASLQPPSEEEDEFLDV